MSIDNFGIKGLTDKEVFDARKVQGTNMLTYKKESGFLDALKSIVTEPMAFLLLVASSIYFISGNFGDGIFLAAAIIIINKSTKASILNFVADNQVDRLIIVAKNLNFFLKLLFDTPIKKLSIHTTVPLLVLHE
ncbi:MAG: magnesium-transporting ATPase (P-type) [Maribacter sp.]|jgi:magnesium-transporting ATPase (P-type)